MLKYDLSTYFSFVLIIAFIEDDWLQMLVKNGLLSRMDNYCGVTEKISTMTYVLKLIIVTATWEEQQDAWCSIMSDFKDASSLVKMMGNILGKIKCTKRVDLNSL